MKTIFATAIKNFLDIPEEELRKILNMALGQGGDFSEIYLEYKTFNFINMEEDIIKETAESISQGMGIRVIASDRTGYGYTNDLSFMKMKKAAETAASIAQSHRLQSSKVFVERPLAQNFYPVKIPAHRETCSCQRSADSWQARQGKCGSYPQNPLTQNTYASSATRAAKACKANSECSRWMKSSPRVFSLMCRVLG